MGFFRRSEEIKENTFSESNFYCTFIINFAFLTENITLKMNLKLLNYELLIRITLEIDLKVYFRHEFKMYNPFKLKYE
jgi:hypothetical protein